VEDVVMLDIVSSSAEEIARYMLNRLTATIKFPSNIEQIEVGIEEERGQAAWCSKRPGEE
jgi:6-pyruvoyltetrahydropterin/6-carboxytetrahydropterin synthase